jgi:uncharacterized protein YbaR (Trm112 family)
LKDRKKVKFDEPEGALSYTEKMTSRIDGTLCTKTITRVYKIDDGTKETRVYTESKEFKIYDLVWIELRPDIDIGVLEYEAEGEEIEEEIPEPEIPIVEEDGENEEIKED